MEELSGSSLRLDHELVVEAVVSALRIALENICRSILPVNSCITLMFPMEKSSHARYLSAPYLIAVTRILKLCHQQDKPLCSVP